MITENEGLKNSPLRILQIAGGFNKGVSGGVAAVINNYYKYIDKQAYRFDFLAISYQCFELYRNDIETAGGTLYCLEAENRGKSLGRTWFTRKLAAFLAEHEYDIIHVNMGSPFNLFKCAELAKKHSRARIIAHSHNAIAYPLIKRILKNLLKCRFISIADYFLACSAAAGENVFPQRILRGERYSILKNAVDCGKYTFDEVKREEYRNKFSLTDEFTLMHVGRFNEQKNHSFLIDIFAEIRKQNQNAKLILVGTGSLLEPVKEKAASLNLTEHIVWAGQRNDVAHCMQAADVFLFPSLFEGLGIAVIEAQASGLPVLASDRLPKDARITHLFNSMPLSAPAEAWAVKALEIGLDYERRDMSAEIRQAGYDIKFSVKTLESVYKGFVNPVK